jgi:hypothetical protein
MSFYKLRRNELGPLDHEILERAFEAAWEAIKGSDRHSDTESDEELELALRRELIEIARLNGVSDPETLKAVLLVRAPPWRTPRREHPIEPRMHKMFFSLSLRY